MKDMIFDELFAELDLADVGTVYDHEIAPAGKFNGLDHNGVWVRVVKLNEDVFAYTRQDDSMDAQFAIGNMDEAAEYIVEQIDAMDDCIALDANGKQTKVDHYRLLRKTIFYAMLSVVLFRRHVIAAKCGSMAICL